MRNLKKFIGICLVILCVVISGFFVYSKKDEVIPEHQKYQSTEYEMTYDASLCKPTYLNSGNCEISRGETWVFENYETQGKYIDYNKGEPPYVEKGMPVIMAIDSMCRGYEGNYMPIENEQEALEAASGYFRWMLENGENCIKEEVSEERETLYELEDGNIAKVKVIDIGNQTIAVAFCQYMKGNELLNKEIQKMYDSFTTKQSENILFSEGKKQKSVSVTINVYADWKKKGDSQVYNDKKLSEDILECLYELPINQVKKSRYKEQMRQSKKQNEDMQAAEFAIESDNDETMKFDIYFTEDDCYKYMEYNGNYYIVTGGKRLQSYCEYEQKRAKKSNSKLGDSNVKGIGDFGP